MTTRAQRFWFLVAATIVAGTVYASSRVGLPKTLPGIALGWPLLFHVERGVAMVAAIGLVALVLWRGVHGDWPTSYGSLLQYAPKEAVKVTAETLEEQDERLVILENTLGLSPPQRP